jgi:nucleotide-binding universal stress UspA family protein
LGAELHLFHATVLHDYHPMQGEGFPETEELMEILSKRSRDLLGRLKEEGPSSLVIKEAERRGTAPAPLILDYAAEWDIGLVVMATHGRRGLSHMWLGSVAEEVVRRSSCPVLTVRTGAEVRELGESARILVPVDFSDSTAPTLEYAATFASLFNAALHLLHVIEQQIQPVFYEAYTELVPSTNEELARTARAELEKLEQKKGLSGAKPHVATGFPTQEILDLAEREKIDLIVMGSQGLTGLAHLLLGSVAERVVRKAPCPVLVVKREGDEGMRG